MTLLVSLILGLVTINVVMAGSAALATTVGWVAGPVVGLIGALTVVGDGWDEGQPVTVWAVCYLMYDCRRDWTRPYRAGVRPTPPVSDHLGLAIADAEASHGLTSAPGAVMVFWVPSVEQALAAPMDSVWFGVRVWNGTWIVTLLAGSAIGTWRRRSRAAPA
jgi:hypothetical protein